GRHLPSRLWRAASVAALVLLARLGHSNGPRALARRTRRTPAEAMFGRRRVTRRLYPRRQELHYPLQALEFHDQGRGNADCPRACRLRRMVGAPKSQSTDAHGHRRPASDLLQVQHLATSLKNKLKQKLAAGQTTHGLWVTLESPTITEIAVTLGYDWVCID